MFVLEAKSQQVTYFFGLDAWKCTLCMPSLTDEFLFTDFGKFLWIAV
jgi:hypothetical protein